MAKPKSFDPDLPDEEGELEYGDTWEDLSWRKPTSDFQRDLLKACGRKYYHTQAEAKRTKALEKNTIKYPLEYIEGWRKWAEKRNIAGLVITFDVLLKNIRHVDNLAKYKQKLKLTQLNTSDDDANERIMNERERKRKTDS